MTQPVLTIIAGPNGSGKSTLTRNLVASGVDLGDYINADEIELTLAHIVDAQMRSREAQKIADARRAACLQSARSFGFETVMSHPSKIDFMRQARAADFKVVLYFVAVDDPELNVARVSQRVALGGHPVPRDRIVARYGRTLALLASALLESDRAVLFDNTFESTGGPRVIADTVIESGRLRMTVRPNGSHWMQRELLDHLPYSGLISGATRSAISPLEVLDETARARTAHLAFP